MSSLAIAPRITANTVNVSAGDLRNLSSAVTTVNVGNGLAELQVPALCKAFRIIAAQNPAPFDEMALGVARNNAGLAVVIDTMASLRSGAREIAHTMMVMDAVKEIENTYSLSA